MNHNFRELSIWKDAVDIAKDIYTLTESFPNHEQFALTTQLTKSGTSISSNIAEGAYRTTSKEFARFLDIAMGSSAEAETQLLIAEWRGYISKEQLVEIGLKINSVQKRTRVFKCKILSNPLCNGRRA